ncbi:MAG TPA: BTAD domain-containing putative transcriptional regulator [Solirubrobacteraceae bacterium]|nr:BTAD domain-containing putative transcriptional regulator [Solirubrobacteraceae bacterium]
MPAAAHSTRIQLCGPLVVRISGVDITPALPGAQGRLLCAYLIAHRTRAVRREELVELLWGSAPPPGAAGAVRALLSKLRRALALPGEELLPAAPEPQLRLPTGAWVDLEAASQALHDAQAAVSQDQDVRAWIASHIALNVSSRLFLAGLDGDWVLDRRAALADLQADALQALAACSIRLGGPELDTAVRAARELARLSPFRETGHAHLMRALAAQGNAAEALRVYDAVRVLLREELGAVPGPELQKLHAALLNPPGSDT